MRPCLARSAVLVACLAAINGSARAGNPGAGITAGAQNSTASAVTFESGVLPILHTRCVKCHGERKREGGLDLSRLTSLIEGGDSGPAIMAGRPDQSLLVERLQKGEMPPKPETPLGASEIARIQAWVSAGAIGSGGNKKPGKGEKVAAAALLPGKPDARTAKSDSSVSENRRFWAFEPPVHRSTPRVAHADRVRTPIDAFVLSRLEKSRLSFNADAPKSVLLRRLCLDLLGLPPTLEQIHDFTRDDRPDAYERLVDRLLASPHYGERWARHWLDLAGYADSDGYLDADRERPEAWRYRDYVIDAHNSDLPFDRFGTEQLAGDEIGDWRTVGRLTPEIARQLTATGFLRTALDPTYPNYTEPNEIHQVLNDTVQIVGSTFLGLTIQCARCHAHKYDPISQRDYYALEAVFLPALDPARWQPSGLRGIPLATTAERARVADQNRLVDTKVLPLKGDLEQLSAKFRKARIAELIEPVLARRIARGAAGQTDTQRYRDDIVAKLLVALKVKRRQRSAEQGRLIAEFLPSKNNISDKELADCFPEFKARQEKLKAAIAAAEASRPTITLLRSLCDLGAPYPDGRILVRGDYHRPGAVVGPGVPAVLAAETRFQPQSLKNSSGRRAALARWLFHVGNPLTARVQVNRLWARHFGRGLVATTANFGHSGARPSHPELLDWLAAEFTRQEWSMKALHRLIVTSTVYRQSADIDATKIAADPDNLLLGAWQPRRIDGETLRDSTLAVAGELNPAMLGRPSPVVRQSDGSVLTGTDAAGCRRSIYLQVRRSQHVTMLELFDTPKMEINCPERNVSTVPLQALAMLHGPFAENSAAALGARIQRSAPTDDGRLDWAFRLLFARQPSPRERGAARDFLSRMQDRTENGKAPPSPQSHRSSNGRDAWAQLALVLLNSNAFLYVE